VADDPFFPKLIAFVVGLCLTNMMVLRRLVNFEF
jgi:flagellar biosynthesis protein FliQ